MDLARPYSVISPGIDGRVLVTLAGITRPLTGSEVARLAQAGSREAVRQALQRLVEQGIVLQESAGRALLYVLNREHLAAPLVEAMASLREQLLTYLRRTLNELRPKPAHAALFGSAARAEGTVASDLDVLVVRAQAIAEDDPEWRRALDGWARRTERATGNRASVSELSEREFRSLKRDRPAIVAELEKDAVTLVGDDVRALLRRGR